MKRRALLAGGMAASFAGPAAATIPSWTLRADDTLYRVALHNVALRCDCFAADSPVPADLSRFPHPPLLTTKARRHGVEWQVADAYQPDQHRLELRLVAEADGLSALVSFSIHPESGVLRRDTVLVHDGEAPAADIRGSVAASFGVREPIERMITLSGVWGQEAGVVRDEVMAAPLLLESRVGKTGFGPQPYVMLRAGNVRYVCQLFWSGNWSLQVSPRPTGAVVQGGLNNWGFRHKLPQGGRLALPSVLFTRLIGDRNRATQALHDYRRAIGPDPTRPIPVQFNSWYPFLGEPSAANLLPLVPVARRLGCEVFVIDSGWHRAADDEGTDDTFARTGDWRTSRQRFPNGLREVSAACHAIGLQFGLWFEPEVLGQLAVVRREHPDWLHHIADTPPDPKERAILHLGVPAAWQFAFDRMTAILKGAAVDWMKWDFNADIGAGGWAPGLPAALTLQDPVVAHYRGDPGWAKLRPPFVELADADVAKAIKALEAEHGFKMDFGAHT